MIQIAEIVQIVPDTIFIRGEALCPDCYEEPGDSDD